MIVFTGCMIIPGHHGLQCHAPSILRYQIERIENCLSPGRSVLFRHDRCNDIDKLRKAGNFHTVCMLQELDQRQSIHNGILIIIDILQKMRVRSPGHVLHILVVLLRGVIPDIPFVEGKIDVLLPVLRCLHIVAGCNHGFQEVLKIVRRSEELRRVMITVSPVLMKGNVIDIVIGFIQDRCLPLSEGRHCNVGRSADNRLNGVIHGLHGLRGLSRKMPILKSLLVPHLPRSIHLIAHAPELDSVGILVSVLSAKVCIIGIRVQIAVFQKIQRIGGSAGSEVDRHHHTSIRLLRPF